MSCYHCIGLCILYEPINNIIKFISISSHIMSVFTKWLSLIGGVSPVNIGLDHADVIQLTLLPLIITKFITISGLLMTLFASPSVANFGIHY